MEYILIPFVAVLASALTLFSGFGLGTLLLPAFALFFPVEVAVGMTALVHLVNNLFKLVLLGRHADRSVVVRFGLPADAAAFVGAELLVWLSDRAALATWSLGDRVLFVRPVGLVIGVLLVIFAILELAPAVDRLPLDRRWLPLGGVLSGFFGGLSGHQGALRSAFLVHARLGKEGFLATGVAIACLVDVTRLSAYGLEAVKSGMRADPLLVGSATLAAIAGAWIGTRMLHKVTFGAIRALVAAMLLLFGLLLGAGIV